MLDRRSRYYKLEDLRYADGVNGPVVYKSRRFLSREAKRPVLWEVEVRDGERPDLIAARTLQKPGLFWRLCDANDVMHPFELTDRPGRRIRVLMPGAR